MLDRRPAGRRAGRAAMRTPAITAPGWRPVTQARASSAGTSAWQAARRILALNRRGTITGPSDPRWTERTGTMAGTEGPHGTPRSRTPRSSQAIDRSTPCADQRSDPSSAGNPRLVRQARRASGEVTAMATTHSPGRSPRRAGTAKDSSS
ncbi:MAG: hypothetical protein M3Q48_14765 [Actinomycetota bacterium]|nr:hypothetical protein [Actinomycetota bacterium]